MLSFPTRRSSDLVSRSDQWPLVDKQTHIRYLIVAMLFIASSFSYGDRVALSFAGPAMEKELALDPVKLGILFSGFSWAYALGQLPSGGLLDRFGSKRVYGISIRSEERRV